jgi:hypothetical protein
VASFLLEMADRVHSMDEVGSPCGDRIWADYLALTIETVSRTVTQLHNALYSASQRQYDGLPELSYPFHDRDILVTACGRICLHRKKINISTVLAGQRVGIKEVDDGIRLVSFNSYDLGYFDLEQKTLQPLDNPFGPRFSPMS